MNCDGVINSADAAAFALALIDPAAYQAQYPSCGISLADLNDDGAADGEDVAPFVGLLIP